MNNLKTLLLVAAVAGLVAGVVSFVGTLVGNQLADQTFGAATTAGITRYPNSGLAARFLDLGESVGTSTALADGALTTRGDTRLTSPVWRDKDGSIPTITDATVTSTQTLTAAQLCDNTILNVDFVTATGTLTLASSSAMIADCLPTAGDTFLAPVTIRNVDGAGQFTIAPGVSSSILRTPFASSTGGPLIFTSGTSTLTLRASSSAKLTPQYIGASSTGGPWLNYHWQLLD